MAQGVLPFIRGIDLSRNCFQDDAHFPDRISDMASLRWLRLNKTKLNKLPDQLSKLQKLEHLAIAHNELHHLHDGDLHTLPRLRVVNARNNHIKDPGIPPELFALEELTTVDFSRNQLERIPEGLQNAKGLLVLSLNCNRLKEIPKILFQECTDLQHFDVSNNELTSIPPQLRRCRDMDTLVLSNNPLMNYKLRALQGLSNLRTLSLRNTERNLGNIPEQLDAWLAFLEDLDISCNNLPQIPPCFYRMEKLKRLDASQNLLSELSSVMESWTDLELLNVSYNKLQALPSQLTKCTKLKRIFLSFNELTFDGIPTGISRLVHLEQFIAASNKLECIPESLCRCSRLQRLVLNSNCLLQLPEGIHFLKSLKQLDVSYNPNLVMPPKPEEGQMGSGEQLYNIDFDIDKLKQGAVVSETEAKPTSLSRKARIFKRRVERNDENTRKVLKGLSGIAEEKTKKEEQAKSGGIPEPPPPPELPLVGKKWHEHLERPNLNYGDIFDSGVGQKSGLTVWLIDNFLPVEVDSAVQKHLYVADAYIVLQTFVDESDALDWKIFFWIGSESTLDKKACAAIHAVNLRNMLGAECRILREEQGEESEAFIEVFGHDLSYVDGGTVSGFYTVEDEVYTTRLYRVTIGEHSQLHLEPVDVNVSSLDPRFVFLLDVGLQLYVWTGNDSSLVVKTKARLFAEKMSKNERKNEAGVISLFPGDEPDEFWRSLGGKYLKEEIEPHVHDLTIRQPHLYRVGLGHGYLELPQVEVHYGKLTKSLLETTDVYILDCFADVFVWIGHKSARLVRVAALKLSQELCTMLDRPSYVMVTRTLEGTEIQLFKSKFSGWDDVLAVDFTKMTKSASKKSKQEKRAAITTSQQLSTKVDLSALFTERQAVMTEEKAKQYMRVCNDNLCEMTCFVLDRQKLSKLPDNEIGVFFSGNCYVCVCNYKVPKDDDSDGEHEDDDQTDTVVYFWEGREAAKTGWVTFKFSFQKKMEERKPDLQVIKMCQQQETLQFLAHFGGCIAIQRGKRHPPVVDSDTKPRPQLFQFRTNSGPLCMRMVEVDVEATSLNSQFCHILKVPFDNRSMGNGVVYVWSGSYCKKNHVMLAEEMAKRLFEEYYSIQSVKEGREPTNFFWVGLGGQQEYSGSADYLTYTRLFRCSNERGYFTVSEKCSDFCQDDLANDDVMILDNGREVFLWVGPGSSEVERKLAAKSAQVYAKYWTDKHSDRPRRLSVVHKGREPSEFKKCFHGWGHFTKVL